MRCAFVRMLPHPGTRRAETQVTTSAADDGRHAKPDVDPGKVGAVSKRQTHARVLITQPRVVPGSLRALARLHITWARQGEVGWKGGAGLAMVATVRRCRTLLTGRTARRQAGAKCSSCSPYEQSMSQPKPRRSFRGTIAPPHTRKNPTQPDLTPAAKPARAVVWSQPRPQDAPASPREGPAARDDGDATRRRGDRQVQGQETPRDARRCRYRQP